MPRSVASCLGIFFTVTGASMTFWITLRCGNRLKSWKTMPVLSRISLTVARLRREASGPGSYPIPSTSRRPEVGSSSRLMHRNIVLLPEPERPKTTTTSPGAMSREMSFNTSFCPNLLQMLWRLTIDPLLMPMRALPDVSRIHPPLELRLEVGKDARDDPVDDRGDDEGLQAVEVLAADLGGPEEELLGTDEPHERRVLDHRDELVAGRGDDHANRLGQHDPAGGLHPRHAERVRGLSLPVPHGEDPGAEDLGQVGAVVEPERQHPRGNRAEDEDPPQGLGGIGRELRERQVDKEDL